MVDPVDNTRSEDELLVAFLDGELDGETRSRLEARLAGEPRLRSRLEALRGGERRFAEAFDALLPAAPKERLDAMLADLVEARPAPRKLRPLAMAAAAVVVFAAGVAVGTLIPPLLSAPEEQQVAAAQPGWRQTVAGYQRYITTASMEVIAEDPASLDMELASVGSVLSIDLSADNLALDHAYLKRVQLFDYRDRPLVQVAYLLRDGGPMSFCIIANGREDEDLEFEEREGFNVIYWTKDGRGYLVIGHAPRETLEAMAGELAARVG